MLPILVSLIAGLGVGTLTRPIPVVTRVAQRVVTALVYAVVFTQGALLGGSDGFASRWGDVLLHAFALALAVSIPTVVAVETIVRLTRGRAGAPAAAGAATIRDALRGVAPGATLLVVGVLAGVTAHDLVAPLQPYGAWPLWALLFAIGFELGLNVSEVARRLRKAAAAFWVGPVTLVAGIAGALAIAPFLPYSPASLAAGAAGVGFYSATGPMITDLDGPVVGGVVFLANMLREVFGIVATVPMARAGISVEASAALGGAVSMDSTLPFLTRGYGARGAVVGLGTGLLLSVAVPVVVPAVYGLVHALFR
jgi:uncharacterized membrane protein YbjE (DUF340 family)